jgi:hypothetical protein
LAVNGDRAMRKIIWVASLFLAASVVVGPALLRSQPNDQAALAIAPAPPPAAGPLAAGPATAPAVATMAVLNATDPAKLQMRANQAFYNTQYSIALPMLQVLAQKYKDNADKLGPIEEQIRVCQKNLASAAAAANQPVLPTSEEQRVPHPAPIAGKVLDISIKELGNFDYDRNGGKVPADVQRLSGVTLRTRGFMLPLDQADNITVFALVPSLFTCCNGQPPQVMHTIVVHCPKGKALNYFDGELVVEGKLTVEEKKDDGFTQSIFDLEASSVRPVPE